jgi:hypothetical protein
MKYKYLIPILFLNIVFFFSQCNTSGGRDGKLYLQSYFFNGLSLSWIYLGDDGTIVINPKNGVDPINYDLEKQNNGGNIGKYIISDKKLKINWDEGKTEEWDLEYDKDDEISVINGGIVTRQKGLPSDYKLNGQYAASSILPNVGRIQTFLFKDDGTFSLNSMGFIQTEDVGSSSQGSKKGTYTIKGNTMHMNFDDGDKLVAVITVFGEEKEKKFLVLNTTPFPQEK